MKIVERIKEMTGMKRVVCETLCAMILAQSIYCITYLITGNSEIAVATAFVATATATAVFVVAVVVVANIYEIKLWKGFSVLILEGLIFFCSFNFFVPYFAIVILILSVLTLIGYFAIYASRTKAGS